MSGTDRYTVEYVGESRQPVVVIDDFHPEPQRLRAMAARSKFRRLSPYYPGIQAPADPRHLVPVEPLLSEIFSDVFEITGGAAIGQCSFSLVTTRDEDLAPIQCLPHVDTTDPGRLALLHYLSGEETGGTAFYRHRATGAEVLTAGDFEYYRKTLEAEGLPKTAYMRGSDDRFELIGHIKAKTNRATVYRSQLLHSGLIPRDLGFSEEATKGRLTLNTFFQANAQPG